MGLAAPAFEGLAEIGPQLLQALALLVCSVATGEAAQRKHFRPTRRPVGHPASRSDCDDTALAFLFSTPPLGGAATSHPSTNTDGKVWSTLSNMLEATNDPDLATRHKVLALISGFPCRLF